MQEKINAKLQRADSSIPTITSVMTMVSLLGYYYLGLLPFIDIPYDVLGLTVDAVSRIKLVMILLTEAVFSWCLYYCYESLWG